MSKNSEDKISQESDDFYYQDGKIVMSESYHIKRGSCCGNGCKYCPYTPVHKKGSTTIFINNG